MDQKYLKESLFYCPQTGAFTWLKNCVNKVNIGSEAGCVKRNRRTNYREIRIDGKDYYAHRLAWLYMHGEWPRRQIDHIDKDGLNNRISNLRDVDNAENAKNARLRINNKSGVTGVCRSKGAWVAQITVGGKVFNLGYFLDKQRAIQARKKAEKEHGFHPNHGSRS